MNPLVPQTAPNAQRLAQLARATARDDKIDPIEHLAGDRVYIFTGSKETDTLKIRFPLIRKRSGKRIFLKGVGE